MKSNGFDQCDQKNRCQLVNMEFQTLALWGAKGSKLNFADRLGKMHQLLQLLAARIGENEAKN